MRSQNSSNQAASERSLGGRFSRYENINDNNSEIYDEEQTSHATHANATRALHQPQSRYNNKERSPYGNQTVTTNTTSGGGNSVLSENNSNHYKYNQNNNKDNNDDEYNPFVTDLERVNHVLEIILTDGNKSVNKKMDIVSLKTSVSIMLRENRLKFTDIITLKNRMFIVFVRPKEASKAYKIMETQNKETTTMDGGATNGSNNNDSNNNNKKKYPHFQFEKITKLNDILLIKDKVPPPIRGMTDTHTANRLISHHLDSKNEININRDRYRDNYNNNNNEDNYDNYKNNYVSQRNKNNYSDSHSGFYQRGGISGGGGGGGGGGGYNTRGGYRGGGNSNNPRGGYNPSYHYKYRATTTNRDDDETASGAGGGDRYARGNQRGLLLFA